MALAPEDGNSDNRASQMAGASEDDGEVIEHDGVS